MSWNIVIKSYGYILQDNIIITARRSDKKVVPAETRHGEGRSARVRCDINARGCQTVKFPLARAGEGRRHAMNKHKIK